MNQYSIVAIHGIGMGTGVSRSGFSEPLKKLVEKTASTKSFTWDEFIWEKENDTLDSKIREIVREVTRGPLLPSLFGLDGRNPLWKNLLSVTTALMLQKKVEETICKAIDLGLDFPWYLDSINGKKVRTDLRKKIRTIRKTSGKDIILLSHSLGSVIAYDCLAEANKNGYSLPVAGLITFGSPLDWTFKLRDIDGRPEIEFSSIGDIPWQNYYYAEDYVPLYKGLDRNRFGKAVQETRLKLPDGVKPHKSHLSYWKDERFAKEIARLAGLSGKTGS